MKNTDDDDFEFEGQENLDLTSHPHPMGIDTHVRIAKDQFSVFELLRFERRGLLVLAPDFQRSDVWDIKHKSELVESILMGIPIPLIYLFEDEKGVRQIIDGKQRVTALKEFLNDDFSLSRLSMLPHLNGQKFSEITPLLQAKLEDYQLHTYVIQPPTPDSVKFIIFDRVNRSGVNLNKQEMRHALYQGKATKLIQDLAESQEFKLATGTDVKQKRMRDRYLILRFVAFYLLKKDHLKGIEYRSDIDVFLALVMNFINTNASNEQVQKIRDACLLGMRNINTVFKSDIFRFKSKKGGKKRPINMGLFEVLVFSFCDIDLTKCNLVKVHAIIETYKLGLDKEGLFSGFIDSNERIKKRFDVAKEIIKKLKNA